MLILWLLCSYVEQAIEEAIARGLQRVEAGAQGEHKVKRGYLPTSTWSSHYLKNDSFKSAVQDSIIREREQMVDVMTMLNEESPYKDRPTTSFETRVKYLGKRSS